MLRELFRLTTSRFRLFGRESSCLRARMSGGRRKRRGSLALRPHGRSRRRRRAVIRIRGGSWCTSSERVSNWIRTLGKRCRRQMTLLFVASIRQRCGMSWATYGRRRNQSTPSMPTAHSPLQSAPTIPLPRMTAGMQRWPASARIRKNTIASPSTAYGKPLSRRRSADRTRSLSVRSVNETVVIARAFDEDSVRVRKVRWRDHFSRSGVLR